MDRWTCVSTIGQDKRRLRLLVPFVTWFLYFLHCDHFPSVLTVKCTNTVRHLLFISRPIARKIFKAIAVFRT